jgi:hypothetical protein
VEQAAAHCHCKVVPVVERLASAVALAMVDRLLVLLLWALRRLLMLAAVARWQSAVGLHAQALVLLV